MSPMDFGISQYDIQELTLACKAFVDPVAKYGSILMMGRDRSQYQCHLFAKTGSYATGC